MAPWIIIVGFLFIGYAHVTTLRAPDGPFTYPYQMYRDFDRPNNNFFSTPCQIRWINQTTINCSVEVTCTDNTKLRQLEFTLLHNPMWRCTSLMMPSEDEEIEERQDEYNDVLVKHINLRILGSDTELELDENSGLLDRINKILLKFNPVDSPHFLYKLKALEDIEINNYKVSILNLTSFVDFKELRKLNVSNNVITDFATNNYTNNVSYTNKLEIFDLSHNLIENVQSSWKLGNLAQLNYLDLSHNAIKNIDGLAFQGLMQLRSLFLSYNHILHLGSSLANLNNIQEVTIDHNEITAIEEQNFAGLYNIEKLNLSANSIEVIEVQAFVSLVKLKELDLNYNKVTTIEKQFFRNNNELCTLSLRNNNIENIGIGAFKGKNITKFDIENNSLSGSIDKNFQAIFVKNIDLSGMKIAIIGPETFNGAVHYLNLSHNSINCIASSAFTELKHLKSLDISYNRLFNVNFSLSSFKELSSLYLQQNCIRILKETTLKNLTSLKELDLSKNWMNHIDNNSFTDMKSLESLHLNNNADLESFDIGTFKGLVSLLYLDFANTSISELQNELFSDLKQLELLNSSQCQIEKIHFYAFKNLYSVKVIDLSYNLLTEFLVNNKDIAQVRELYLNFNKIKSILDDTFHGLSRLFLLDLSSNNIAQIGVYPFNSLIQLKLLNLGSNTDMEIHSETFSNMSLHSLVLKNITKRFNFEHTFNTRISILDLSSCQIETVDRIFVYNLNLKELFLNSNQITELDKLSFQNLSSLEYLDISSNAISYIQPGTFLQLENLQILNIHDNNLNQLDIGAFEGLKRLLTLNLSSNEISSFKLLNVRNLHSLKILALDNNKINIFSFSEFAKYGIVKITIGGNNIPCSDLILNLEHNPFAPAAIVTAEILNFHSENVDGITCSQTQENYKGSFNPQQRDNFINAIDNLSNAVEKLQKTISNKINSLNDFEGNSSVAELRNINNTLPIAINNIINNYTNVIFEKTIRKMKEDFNLGNGYHLQNENSYVKSLVYISVACLVVIVVMYMTIFVPKLLKLVFTSRLRRPHRDIPLINNFVEME